MDHDHAIVSLYENSIPPFVNEALDRLYQRMHSSLAYHRIYGNISPGTSTYVARKNGEIVAVLLFFIEGGRACVLNEQLWIHPDEIERFSVHVFSTYQFVKIISFPAMEGRVDVLSFPYQQCLFTQDIVLNLPDTAQAYLTSLGKSTRSYVKRYLNKLKGSFPSLSCATYERGDITEQHIRDITALNRARMARRHKSSNIDEAESERMIRLARLCGLVTIVTIDGRVCAGTINYRFGENYFLQVVAHDPKYDEYGLGMLCCYLTICECIARKGNEYHFLWGRYEYKYRLLGLQRDLAHLVIYRSRLELLMNSGAALKLACKGYEYEAKDWMEHKARRMDNSSLFAKLAFYCLNWLKKRKRSITGLQARGDGEMEARVSIQKK